METIYSKALLEVGDDGNFQRSFDILYNLVFIGLWSVAYVNIILTLVIIPYNCALPEKPDNISDYNWKLKYIPTTTGAAGENKFSSCYINVDSDTNTSNETKECTSYSYDRTWYNSTIPSERDWVCDKEIYVANAIAYSRLGEVFGSLIFGWLGDIYGRKFTYILSLVFLVAGRSISIFGGDSFSVFSFGCIVASFPSWAAYQSITVISLEICSAARRTRAVTIRAAAWTIGLCLMPFLYWWLQNWKWFLILTTIPQAGFLLFSWKMIESPRWHWVEGKNEACIKVLKQIAKSNGKTLSDRTEQELLASKVSKTNSSTGVLALFSNKTIAVNTMLELSSWICVTLSYTVLLISAGEKTDGNPFLEFAWQTAAEMPGNFLGAWLSDKIGRRHSGVLSYGIMSFMWILVTLRSYSSSSSWTQAWWIGTGLFMLNRLFINVTYYVVSLFNMELYPTCLRQTGMSLSGVVASLSSALGPYIIFLGHRVGPVIPSLILTATSLIGVLIVYLLPETLNARLPETIEDAKKFKRRKREDAELTSIKMNGKKDSLFTGGETLLSSHS
ncbi:organic cation transporter protein [Plutella xylostella]|uniref:organic cation transporter protein n=1 Tax=Plutella xylostella TaxID=51655 RepID=UPI002032D974|nr:organic cation transporter protein [Plutella xylostella]